VMEFSIIDKEAIRIECDCGDIYIVSLYDEGGKLVSLPGLPHFFKNRYDLMEKD